MNNIETPPHPRHPMGCQCQHKNQSVAQVEPAQAATKPVAGKPTLGEFQAWLLWSQQDVLYSMNNSTGEAFGKHCDEFMQLTTAYSVYSRFMTLSRG